MGAKQYKFMKFQNFYTLQRYCLILLFLGTGLLLRLIFASRAQHPGHGDPPFYYTVAENIVDGRGLQIDYIWHYLSKPETITHASHDYWMPLASIIISIFMYAFGKSLFVALLPSILFGLGLGGVTYFWSRVYTSSDFVALSSACLVVFIPYLFRESLLTDTTVYYAVFVSLALYFMIKGYTNARAFLLSAVFIGLAHLTRQDGFLLVPVLLTSIFLSQHLWKTKCRYVVLSLALYGTILLPLLIKNYQVFGSLSTPGVYKIMFLRTWGEAYSYKEHSLQNYLDYGLANILRMKIDAGFTNVQTLYRFLGGFLWAFVILGLFGATISRDRWRIYLPPLLFLGLLYFLHTIVFSTSGMGSFEASAAALIPFFLIVSLEAVERYMQSRAITVALVVIVTLWLLNQSIGEAHQWKELNTQMGRQLAKLQDVLSKQSDFSKDTVIMTRNPWEVYHSTRCKAVQIPNDDLDTIFQVASKYRATYLLLPTHRPALASRLYSGELSDERFVLVAVIPDSSMKVFSPHVVPEPNMKLFRIKLTQ
jgi:4-amino-4-deoxy-L-arabinose transferase-like glycosyltransferase